MCEHAVSSRQPATVANLLSMQRSFGWCNAQRTVAGGARNALQRDAKLVAPTTQGCQTARTGMRAFYCTRRVGMLRASPTSKSAAAAGAQSAQAAQPSGP